MQGKKRKKICRKKVNCCWCARSYRQGDRDRETEIIIIQNSLKVEKRRGNRDKNAGENTEKNIQEKGKLLLVCSILQTGRQRRGNEKMRINQNNLKVIKGDKNAGEKHRKNTGKR